MDNSLGMRGVERVGQLNRNVQQAVDGQRTGVESLIEVLSLEQFHRNKRLRLFTLVFFNRVDGANVGMVQRRRSACFQQEAVESVLIARELRRQELQGDFAPEVQVLRLVHNSHASTP